MFFASQTVAEEKSVLLFRNRNLMDNNKIQNLVQLLQCFDWFSMPAMTVAFSDWTVDKKSRDIPFANTAVLA